MVKDPVCGMEVDEKTGTVKSKVNGKFVYFCCPHCKSKFDKDQLISKFRSQFIFVKSSLSHVCSGSK